MNPDPSGRRRGQGAAALILGFLLLLSGFAHAADTERLRPPDRMSPRAALLGFLALMDDTYDRLAAGAENYAASGQLYPTREAIHEQSAAMQHGRAAAWYLDLSRESPALRGIVGLERVVQLKEVLDRIALPAADAIPDTATVIANNLKRWRIPNTEIDFVRIEDGPRQGEFVISADTIARLPEFYGKLADLPYGPGSALRLNTVYRTLSGERTATIYEALLNAPGGLAWIVPPRWLLRMPDWAQFRLFGAAAWQWLGLALGAAFSWLVIVAARRVSLRLAARRDAEGHVRWQALPLPLALLLISGLLIPIVLAVLRIGGAPRVFLTYLQDGTFYLAGAWVAVIGSALLGEIIVSTENLNRGSLDSQLLMLGTRSVGILVAVGCLIQGADDLGFPAYSVIAGLGVGGLAVALAARDTVANFLGSMLIILEKPFRIGHLIRVSGSEGTVESVGFRSTRLRTADNSIVSIPSSIVVNTTVENLTLRPKRRQRFFVQVTYDTPLDKLRDLIARIQLVLQEDPLVEAGSIQVQLYNLSESSLDILVVFHLQVDSYAAEIEARENVLLRIMAAAAERGIAFAFPTQTVHFSGSETGAGSTIGAMALGTHAP